MIIALVYLVFALIDGRGQILVEELLGIAFFAVMAWLGYQRDEKWIFIVGLIGHAIWDWAHQPDLLTGYVPAWYPAICLAYDLALAVIVWRQYKKAPTTPKL